MKKLLNPDLIAGCYTLHLYCKYENSSHSFREFPHIYTHEYGKMCRSKARKQGWIIHKNGTATCPKCNKQKGVLKND